MDGNSPLNGCPLLSSLVRILGRATRERILFRGVIFFLPLALTACSDGSVGLVLDQQIDTHFGGGHSLNNQLISRQPLELSTPIPLFLLDFPPKHPLFYAVA